MKNPYAFAILFLVVFQSVAQDTSYTYFDVAWKETVKAKSAYFRKKFKLPAGWGVIDYYSSGLQQMSGAYSNDSCTVQMGDFTWYSQLGKIAHTCRYTLGKEDGPEVYYYENGGRQVEGNYSMGRMEGEWTGYYPSGSLSGKAFYKSGDQQAANFFNEDGSVNKAVEQFMRQAVFPGGTAGLVQYLNANLAYPKKAVKDGIKGTVVVQFIVTTEGKIEEAAVVQSVEASLDREALRVVKKMPHWVPSVWGGKYVKSYMKQPITFRFE